VHSPAQQRLQPVGSQYQLSGVAAYRADRDRMVVADFDVGDGGVGDHVHAGRVARPDQDRVQVASVDHHVRGAVTMFGGGQVEIGQLGSVDRVVHDQPAGQHPLLDDLAEQPPRSQDAGAIGGQLQPESDLAELGGLWSRS
jgi:hypothetical protein